MRSPELPAFEYRPELEPTSPEVAPARCLLNILKITPLDEFKSMSSCVDCDRCGARYNPLENTLLTDQLQCAEVTSADAAKKELYRNHKGM